MVPIVVASEVIVATEEDCVVAVALDLRQAMAEAREVVLIASAWAALASRAAQAGDPPDRVRWLIARTEDAAVAALERMRAIDTAIGAS